MDLFTCAGLDEVSAGLAYNQPSREACRRMVDLCLASVPGLAYHYEYIDIATERALLQAVDGEAWSNHWQRRTQYYGQRYLLQTDGDDDDDGEHPFLPAWTDTMRNSLFADGIFGQVPNQVGVNEYLAGQGIAPHVDYRGGPVVSMTLASGCLMDFTPLTGDESSEPLPQLSPRKGEGVLLSLAGTTQHRRVAR